MNRFTYIIPFNSSVDNINNLRRILKWVNGWNNVDIIVVEYSNKHPKLGMVSEPFLHIPLKCEFGVFNKGWAYNAGMKQSKTEIIVFGDSSTITNPNNIKKGIELLKEYDVVKPFSTTIDISKNQLSDFDKMDKTIDGPVVGNDGDRPVYFSSGINIYNKDALMKIGGWEEKFEIDCYDDFQSYKIKKFTKWIELDGKGYNLQSGKAHNDGKVSSDVNTNNQLKVLNDSKLTNYIKSTYNNIGSRNKYE